MPPSRLITRIMYIRVARIDALKFVNLDLLAYVARTRSQCISHIKVVRWQGGRSCNRVGAVIRSVVRGGMNGKGSICLAASEEPYLAA